MFLYVPCAYYCIKCFLGYIYKSSEINIHIYVLIHKTRREGLKTKPKYTMTMTCSCL